MAETRVIVPPTGKDERSERDILKSIEHNVAYFVSLFEQMIDSMSNLPLPGANRLKRK
jgi:hypothetical protein